MKKIKLILVFVLFILIQTGEAQITTDNELWTGASFNLKINKRFSASLEEQLRINNNVSSLNQTLTEVGLKFKINKYLGIKGHYRYVGKPQSNNKTRLSLDLLAGLKKKGFPVSFNYRLRLQRAVTAVTGKTKSYIRNKFEVGYNLSKLVDPYVSYELYYFRLKQETRVTRLTIGLDWRLNKRMDLTTFYRIQNNVNVKNLGKRNIVGIMFAYNTSIKKLKKKKKANVSI